MSLPSARSIAFNRRLRSVWLEEGLRLRAEGIDETQWLERMEDLVRIDTKGRDSIQKSMRYLRHIWTDSGGEDPLRTEAIQLYKSTPTHDAARVLSWGMASATYPFLHEVAATLCRMLKVQPEVKLEQLLRKLSETHGEKETVRRSGRYSLGLIHDLGFVKRAKSAGCYVLAPPIRVTPPEIAAWLARAWFRASGKEGLVDRTAMASAPGLAFFDAPALIADALQQGVLVVERLSFSQDSLRIC
jgi:hypothetical protein